MKLLKPNQGLSYRDQAQLATIELAKGNDSDAEAQENPQEASLTSSVTSLDSSPVELTQDLEVTQ